VALLYPTCTSDAAAPAEVLDGVAARAGRAHGRAFFLVHPTWREDVADGLRQRLAGREVGLALPPDTMEGKRPVVVVLWPRAPEPGAVEDWPLEFEDDVKGVKIRFYNGAAHTGAEEPRPEAAAVDPGDRPGFVDLRTKLREARVRVEGRQGLVTCDTWDGAEQRWVCPGMDEWNFVGPRRLSFEGRERTCLWAHPVTGAPLVMAFPGVVLGRALRLGRGLADGAAGLEGAADVVVKLAAGRATREVVHANAPGWVEERVETTPGPGDVTLTITTPHDGARHFCVSLVVEP
jgi:hypothetical protein